MAEPIVHIAMASNQFFRMMHFEHAGDREEGHAHPFDHITHISKGVFDIEVDGVVTEFTAPTFAFIAKEKFHALTAKTDGAVATCCHVLRDDEGQILDPEMVPKGQALRKTLNKLRGRKASA